MKKTLKAVLAVMLALVMVFSLCACGEKEEGGNEQQEEKTYTFRMSGTVNEEHMVTKCERYFEQRLEELSGGRIQLDLYPNNQLGEARAMLEAVANGDCDMIECGSMVWASFTDELKFYNLPFMWTSRDAAYEFWTTDMGKEIMDAACEDVGAKIIGWIDNCFFNFTSNKKFNGPQDTKGFKIRCQESDVLLQIWKDLGASPFPLAFGELYTALQQGTAEGQMNGYLTTFNSAYYEVQKYVYKCGLLFDLCPLAINADLYNSLPEDLQKAVDQAGADMVEYSKKNAREECLKCYEGLVANGMEVIDLTEGQPAREAWVEASKATYDWFRATYPQIDLDARLAKVEELNAKYADAAKNEVI